MDPTGQLTGELVQHVEQFAQNVARTHNLVSIYTRLGGGARGRRSVGDTDVLRSAVVLLHASVEDFLRSVARVYLPRTRPEVLNSVPLKGVSRSGRPEKFLLGQLDAFRGLTVDELIDQSVEAHLERSNFNNTGEMASLLESLDLGIQGVRQFFPLLDTMTARRHQIVHRADCTTEPGPGRHLALSLRLADVQEWITNAYNFVNAVSYSVQAKEKKEVKNG